MTTTARVQQVRLAGVDVARGTALLAMMAVHVFPSADPAGGTTQVHQLLSGRAAALFAVLAGVGLALLTGGERPRVTPRLRAAVAVRAVLVAALGLLLGSLESGLAVILVYYGVLFLVAVPLLGLPVRALALLAAVVAVVGPVAGWLLQPRLPPRSPVSPTFDDPVEQVLTTVLVTGYYPVLSWTAYLCAGLAVGRLALGASRVQAGLLAGGAALSAAATALSAWLLGPLGGLAAIAAAEGAVPDLDASQYGDVPTTTAWWLAVDAPHSSTPPDVLATTGSSLAVLGLALLLTRAGAVRALLRPLAAAGAMPLTLYGLHVLVVDATEGDRPLLLWTVQAVLFPLGALLWLQSAKRGPLEAVVAAASLRR